MDDEFVIELKPTSRAFLRGDFHDATGAACSIQESSQVGEFIWLGRNENEPPHPTGGPLSPRMHLTREMAAELVRLLTVFVETGYLDDEETQPEDTDFRERSTMQRMLNRNEDKGER